MADRSFRCELSEIGAVVRHATPGDYDDVIGIDDNVYDGCDYVAFMFHQFLQSKHCLTLVIEQDGKLVGLIIYRFHDDDPHVVTAMSGRIAKSLRGQGFMHGPLASLQNAFLQHFPQLTHYMFMHSAIYSKPGTFKKFYYWKYTTYGFSVQSLRSRLADFLPSFQSVSPPHHLTYQMANNLLTTGDRLQQFFGRYCVDYVPALWEWRPMKINNKDLKELFATSTLSLYTADGRQTNKKPGIGGIAADFETITSISYAYAYTARIGLVYTVFFFGDDASLAVSHAVVHAEHVTTIWNGGDVCFVLHVPEQIDSDQVEAAGVGDLFGGKFMGDKFVVSQYLMGSKPLVPQSNL